MSTTGLKSKRFLRKLLSEDLKIIIVFLFLILSIWNGFVMGLGWLSDAGSGFNTPSVGQDKRTQYPDNDRDLLPNIIEEADKGVTVNDPVTGKFIGWGTGTNPNKKDTDGDLFTDAAEDNLGSNANQWLDPGWIWIVWSAAIVYFIYRNFVFKEDKLREYEEFETLQHSSGVAGEGGKFAHGGGSIFAKRASDMSEEEKKTAIQQDARFHRMTAESTGRPTADDVPFWKKQNWKRLGLQFGIVLLVMVIFLWLRSA